MRDGLRPHATSKMREVSAAILAVPAMALTAFLAYAGFDMATTTYVGYEVGLARFLAMVTALLAVLAWTGVVVLHRSARRDLRAGPRRVMVVALLSTFGFLVLAQLVDVVAGEDWTAVAVALHAVTVAAGVTALGAALRL